MADTNRPEFAAQLIALGQHLAEHPDLPQIYDVMERLGGGFEVRLMTGGEQAFTAWAASLPIPITSYAYRYANVDRPQIDGHVLGYLGGHVFEVVGALPADSVPAEGGRHEWTVTR